MAARRQKRTTLRVGDGVTADSIALSLLGFQWMGGPYFLELAGDRGSIQVWAADKAEAERFVAKMLAIGGYPENYEASCVRTEKMSEAPRVQQVRRFELLVRDGLAYVSDRQGPGGTPAYPVVLGAPPG